MSDSVDWPRVTLRSITESAVDGPFGSALKTEHYVAREGVRVVRLQNIGAGYFRDEDRVYISNAYGQNLSRHNVVPGDLIIASMGDESNPVGRACQYPVDGRQAIVKADCFRVRVAQNIADPAHVRHLLNGPRVQAVMARAAHGVTRDRMNLTSLLQTQIPLPTIPEQRRIAEILDSADESIRCTAQLIAKLEHARHGLASDLIAPRRVWRSARLGELLRIGPKNGYSPKEVDAYTGMGMLGLGCLTPTGFSPRQIKNAPSGDPAIARAKLSDGDLLMSRANTRDLVGHVGRFRDIGIPCIYPDLMMRLTPNDSVRSDFLELVLSSPLVRRQIQARAVGTSASMVKISSAIVIDLEVRLPDLAEQDHILRIVSSADAALGAARHERKKRLALKQGLMEDLLTGRVRVKVGEGVVG